MEIVHARREHHGAFHALYRRVAAVPDLLVRRPAEITDAYTRRLLAAATDAGAGLLALDGRRAAGAIVAVRPVELAFRHTLTDLTIFVDPADRGRGLGRRLFETFLDGVRADLPGVERVELYVREGNARAVALYESLGFVREGRHPGKIATASGGRDTPLSMAWSRGGRGVTPLP